MGLLRGRRGIALPVVLFVILVLTIALAASFARVDAERAIAAGSGDVVGALNVAQSGLQAYLGSRTSPPPDGDSVRFNVPGGYADVVAHVALKPLIPPANQTYIVRSTGYVIVPERGAVHQAARTVAQFAYWQVGTIRRIAAYTAANRLRRITGGGSGTVTISGVDGCAVPALPTGSVRTRGGEQPAGLIAPNSSYSPSLPDASGGGGVVADLMGIDWSTIVNGGFDPDYTALGTDPWKSYLITGNATINGWVGSGLLIVTGDLTIQGGAAPAGWDGVVLVGGAINPEGGATPGRNTTFQGLVFSGLNEMLGGPVPPRGTMGGGPPPRDFTILYRSCTVDSALASLNGLIPVRNAWVDSWATY